MSIKLKMGSWFCSWSNKKIIKSIGLIVLLCFASSSSLEAGQRSARHSASTTNKKIKKPTIRKKREAVSARKRRPQASKSRNRPQRISSARKRQSRTAARRTRQPRAQTLRQKKPRKVAIRRGKRRSIALAPIPVPPPPSYLSQLKPHTQTNAQLGGLDKLFLKDLKGQGITVAVIEESGTWKFLRDAINNMQGNLSPETRERYRNNFLPAIGGGTLPPEETNACIRSGGHLNHGADVTSVILDLSPQAKVRPTSTYDTGGSPDSYDVADAMMNLSQRADVNIINISSGYINFTVTTQAVHDENGVLQFLSKTVYTPKLVAAFRAVAQAGKVVVLAAGNEGNNIKSPEFSKFSERSKDPKGQIMGHLIETLDAETRQSVIIAGAYDPDTGIASGYSNKPGDWAEAQERFLFAPGKHMLPYLDYIAEGTSYASPYICAALADLCSMPGVTPKRAVKALLETADQRPEKAIYGRGVIRADRAAEWLEAGNY